MDATPGYGARLRELRKRARRTQEELAAEAGVDRGTVWRLEKGRGGEWAHAKDQVHRALRKHLSFSEPWLVYGIGTWEEGTPGDGAGALERYLAGPLAVDIREEVRDLLRRIPWDNLGVAHWSQEAIHVIRLGVETQLAPR